jgi:DNA-directed RNA polymerase specialized sigma24 family protein
MKTISQSNTPLAGSAAYRQTIPVERPGRAEEAHLIEAARAGNPAARADLVTLCQARAWSRAVALAGFYHRTFGAVLDPQDIAQEAMLRAWLRIDKALAAPNPVGYLFKAIEGAMLTFCREQRSLIRVPACQQSWGRVAPAVFSLDASLIDGEEFTLLDLLAS